jgi:hypothetical protein
VFLLPSWRNVVAASDLVAVFASASRRQADQRDKEGIVNVLWQTLITKEHDYLTSKMMTTAMIVT